VVVEGYTDVIMSALSGIDNVVSSSGTALTLGQLKLIKRLTDNIILGYDMDLAGDTANKRGIDLATSLGFNVSVARPPFEGKDPGRCGFAGSGRMGACREKRQIDNGLLFREFI